MSPRNEQQSEGQHAHFAPSLSKPVIHFDVVLLVWIQGAEVAANRFRECANAIAKSSAVLMATPSWRADRPKEASAAAEETFVAISAEALRLEIVAACWKGGKVLQGCFETYVHSSPKMCALFDLINLTEGESFLLV